MALITDQTGRQISVSAPPQRVVSLVPSQTELLAYLGLDQEVVGITRFCTDPRSWYRRKTRVGGTKDLHLDLIRELQPDLIIANKEENTLEQVNELESAYPVWVSDIANLNSALGMIRGIGKLCDRENQSMKLAADISNAFSALRPPRRKPSSVYLIWKDPWMTVGADTFIHFMMNAAGFSNYFTDRTRYPSITEDELISADPEFVLLSSEPYPFREKHRDELASLLPHAKLVLVDGKAFSWYGSRLLHSPAYFDTLRSGAPASFS